MSRGCAAQSTGKAEGAATPTVGAKPQIAGRLVHLTQAHIVAKEKAQEKAAPC